MASTPARHVVDNARHAMAMPRGSFQLWGCEHVFCRADVQLRI